jgi:hypothetical protein
MAATASSRIRWRMELVEGTSLLYADYSTRKPEIARAMTNC